MSILIRWMGGAGFLITYKDICIGIDIYLSNSCMDKEGNFKRLIPIFEDPKTLKMDYLIATHEHGDHLDLGCIDYWFSGNEHIKLIGPANTLAAANCVPGKKKIKLNTGDRLALDNDISVEAVFCDHGDLSPDCIGVIINLGCTSIYFTSDTCYRPDLQELTGVINPDVLLVPINPAYGNPGATGAAKIAKMFSPEIVIPCHFWLFKEHGGDPEEFEKECKNEAPGTRLRLLAIGEELTI